MRDAVERMGDLFQLEIDYHAYHFIKHCSRLDHNVSYELHRPSKESASNEVRSDLWKTLISVNALT